MAGRFAGIIVAMLMVVTMPVWAYPPGPFSWIWGMDPVQWLSPTVMRVSGTVKNDAGSIYTLDSYKILTAYISLYPPEGGPIYYLVQFPDSEHVLAIPDLAPGQSWTGLITDFELPNPLSPAPENHAYLLWTDIYAIGNQQDISYYEPTFGSDLSQQQFVNPPAVPEAGTVFLFLIAFAPVVVRRRKRS